MTLRAGFRYEICCRAGVLCFACSDDFLVLVHRVCEAKRRYRRLHPDWTDLRARLFAPNGRRVSRQDLRAALVSLSDQTVLESVLQRVGAASAAGTAPRAAGGGTAAQAARFSASGGSDFRQAGVVAPPDSLTGETRPLLGDSL